jgi:hypothetical protein
VLTASADKTARLWPILPPDMPPPDWCGDFLVWLGGKRIAQDGQIQTLSGDELLKLESRLRLHMNEDTDYARLLRWRLFAPEQRPVDPYGTTTQEQAADMIIRPNMNKAEAEHAYDLLDAHRPSSGDWADLGEDDSYFWDHLAYHLSEAGRVEELVTTVKDLFYVAAKTFVRGAFAVEIDLLAAEQGRQ